MERPTPRPAAVPAPRPDATRAALLAAAAALAVVAAVVLVVLLIRPTIQPARRSVDVPWSDYPSRVQVVIDGYAADRNCDGLREEAVKARAGDADTRARTGHGNEALLAYIDEQLRMAGCAP